MKKKSFFPFFIKRWIPMLLIAVILGGVATYGIHEIVLYNAIDYYEETLNTHIMKSLDYSLQPLLRYPETIKSEEEQEILENRTTFFLSCINICLLYNSSTAEIVYPKEESAILLFRLYSEDPDSRHFYSCPMSYFKSIPIDQGAYYNVKDFYIKGTEFLPGNIIVTNNNKEKAYDLTPSDTTGYTHYTDDDAIIVMSFSTIPEFATDFVTDYYSNTDSSPVSWPTNYYEPTDQWMTYDCLSFSGFTLDDTSYVLVSNYTIDIWLWGFSYFVTTYIALFFTCLLLAVISALLSYKRYEMLRYQQNLTNALAHDLKSPLMVVSGYVENLSTNIYPEKHNCYKEGIVQNVQYMNDIIRNILELSRIQTTKTPLDMKTQNVAPLFQNILEKYDTLIGEKQLSVRLSGDATIKCETVSLTRAFDNLITNAISHSPEMGTIEIQISEKQISISNPYTNEITCKPEKLLEPFTKGDNSRGETTGTGLGLSIATSIFELHKFSIKLSTRDDIFAVTIKL